MTDTDAFSPLPEDDPAVAASAASVQEIYAALSPERLGAEAAEPPPPAVPAEVLAAQGVDVVLVCHDGERWLPRALAALAASDLQPRTVVAVDTGSTDGTAGLLAEAGVVDHVVTLPVATGYSTAVSSGVAAATAAAPAASGTHAPVPDPQASWLWLLHDDSAVHPDTLRRLLASAIEQDAGVAGPKVLSWDRRRQLVEMGVTISGSGRRVTGLERREYDQGQHDDRVDVLAVGSAGMLVRREVWDALDGFDPQLELFRDDVDFGWRARRAGARVVVVPGAVLEHVEAAAHGRRRRGTLRQRAHLVDRRNALHVLLANADTVALPFVLLRSVVGSVLRALGFMLGKVPGLAYDEMVALTGALRPGRLRQARRWRRGQPREGSIDGLRPTLGHQLRQAVDNLTGLLAGTGAGQDVPGARRRAAPGLVGDEEEDEPLPTGESLLLQAVTRPGFLLFVGVTLLTLLASRGLVGPGRLVGGALLPAPSSSGELWATYVQAWHPVGLGSADGAPPYLAVLSGLSLLLLDSAPAAVTALLLLSLPVAAVSAYRALRGVVRSTPVRLWAGATYAGVLAASGAVGQGRLGTCVAAVLAPPLVRAVLRAVPPAAPWRLAWSAGFLLAVTAAFAPVVWPVLVVAAGITVVLGSRHRASLARLAVVALTPPVLLLPWTLQWFGRPELLLMEPGRTGVGAELADPALAPWAPVLLSPGGAAALPLGLLAAVPLLALAAWARLDRRRDVTLAWTLALVALAAALLTSRVAVAAPVGDGISAGWPGPAVLLVALGLLAAVALAADGAGSRGRGRRTRPTRLDPRLRGLLVAGTVAAVATTAAVAVVTLDRGLADPLRRVDSDVLPVYIAEEAVGPDRPRTLVVGSAGADVVGYALLRDRGPQIGDAEVLQASPELDALVGDLLSGGSTTAASAWAAYGVRYVYVPAPADPAVVEALDGQAGLVRASAPEGGAVWRVEGTTGRVRVLAAGQDPGEPVGVLVPSGPVDVSADISIPQAATLVVAERDAPGWRASLDGEALERVEADVLAFALPSGTGTLVVSYADQSRAWWLAGQGVLLLAVLVLMLPSVRRDEDELEDAVDLAETGAHPVGAWAR